MTTARKAPRLAVLAAALMVCLFALAAWSFYNGHANAVEQRLERCEDINRGLSANRAAWKFMETTIKAGWETDPPRPDTRDRVEVFFAGINKRLAPIDC